MSKDQWNWSGLKSKLYKKNYAKKCDEVTENINVRGNRQMEDMELI